MRRTPKMERKILHVDINNCYASIECSLNSELQGKPVAVGGDPEQRHGIILAKNQIAKGYGIKTGETIWEAKNKCPDLVVLKPRFPIYLRYSKRARAIYESYADRVEPFGIDECWMDVSGYRGDPAILAEEIRRRMKEELKITVSVGVSFNKIFAKLGSDMKKPDAVTIISKDNFRDKVWSLPVSDLLFVGRATTAKLLKYGIHTIGELANTRVEFLTDWFGKNGVTLWRFANGLDDSPVMYAGAEREVKSVGNGTTAYRDLVNEQDVRVIVFTLAESVAMRLREHKIKACGVSITVRDKDLVPYSRQQKLDIPTSDAVTIARTAMELFSRHHRFDRGAKPVRSVTICGFDVVPENAPIQLDVYTSAERLEKSEQLNKSLDKIRMRYGYTSVKHGVILTDKTFSQFDTTLQNEIHPVGVRA